MLRLLRQNATNWLIKIILGAIVVVFVFWGVGSFRAQRKDRVALVNGETITSKEYREAYLNIIEQLRQRLGNNLNDDMIKMLNVKSQALDMLIDRKLMLQEAAKLNLKVTNDELVDTIRQIEAFQTDGNFDGRIYRNVLNQNRLTPQDFELIQNESILIEKIRAFILSNVKVSAHEAIEWFKWEHTSVNIDFVIFEPGRYDDINPTNDEISSFFENHKESYKTDAMIKVRFLRFAPDAYRSAIKITNKEIKDYYESNIEKFKTQKNEETDVLFKDAKDKIRNKLVKERAKNLAYEEAEAVYDICFEGDDLTKNAETRGLNIVTTDFFTKNKGPAGIKNSSAFASYAFGLSLMEIGDIQDFEDGYYIIQPIERIPEKIPELKEVEEKIRVDLIKQLQDEKASKYADEFLDALKDNKSPETKWDTECKKLNLKTVSTGFFKRNSSIPYIGLEQSISRAAFNLSSKNIFLEAPVKGEKGYYIIRFRDRKEPGPNDGFDKEKENIKEKLLKQKMLKTFDVWLSTIRNKSVISIEKNFGE